jgi:exodeoxyribonuclease VII small subunit
MTYQQAVDELKSISLRMESEELDLDQMEALLARAKDLSDFCRNALRRVHDQIDAFQNNLPDESTE